MAHVERFPGFVGKGGKAMLSTTTGLFLPPTLLPIQTSCPGLAGSTGPLVRP